MIHGEGRSKPSKAMSAMSLVMGAGMLLSLAGFFFGGPGVGVSIFVTFWVIGFLTILGYHIANLFSDEGSSHGDFEFTARASESVDHNDFEAKLRKIQRLKDDGLITADEYQQKRSEIMSQQWN